MDFEKIKITDIIPAPYNPRIMSDDDKEKLRRSMSEYGLVDPIIINLKNMTIIGGHQRYDILLEGYAEEKEYNELNLIRLGDIGWVFTEDDLTIADEAHEKGLNLILNRVTGEWDNDKTDTIETSDVAATVDNTTIDNNSPGYYQITLLFDTEEEMTEAFDTLVSEGYNCRMSDS